MVCHTMGMTDRQIHQVTDEPEVRFLPAPPHFVVREVFLGYNSEANPGPAFVVSAKARVPGHRRLEANIDFASRAGRRVITQLRISEPDPDNPSPAGVTFQALRALPLSMVQREVDALLANYQAGGRIPSTEVDRVRRRPGRTRRSPEFYLPFAVDYARSSSRAPVRDLARKHHVAVATMREYIRMARRHGLLTTEGKGRTGGHLTGKAWRMRSQSG
jgi:hypothetical protein